MLAIGPVLSIARYRTKLNSAIFPKDLLTDEGFERGSNLQ